MRIITLTPDASLGRLRPHIGADTLVDVATVEQFVGALRTGAVRWAVIDPMAVSETGFETAVTAIASAGVSVAFYSALAGFDHSRLLRTYTSLLPEVVFRETDDDWVTLRRVLRSVDGSVSARLLRTTLPKLQRLAEPLRGQTVSLFAWKPVPSSVLAFSLASDLSTGSVRTDFQRIGLRSPGDVLCAARLAQLVDDLTGYGSPLETLAETHGFGTLRSLERRLKKAVGLTPREIRRAPDRVAFSRRLAQWLAR